MLVAAYVVGGFLDRVGVRDGDAPRPARSVPPARASSSRSRSRAIATPIQMGVGDTLARWVYNNEPAEVRGDRARAEDRRATCPRRCSGTSTRTGPVEGGIPIPGLASILSDPSDGTSTVVQGRNAFPERRRSRRSRQANTVHLAWDVMVGLGTLLVPARRSGTALSWLFRRDIPKTKWFLRIAACAGVLSVIAMEAGWVVTEVGRQPWIVRNYMKVEDAATGEHRRVDHVPRGRRALRGRRRHDDPRAARHEPALARSRADGVDETDVPYGPSDARHPAPTARDRSPVA